MSETQTEPDNLPAVLQADLDALIVAAARCGIKMKSYKVCMNKTYVRTLTMLAAIAENQGNKDGWFKVGQDQLGKELAHDLNHFKYSKLRYWGLIEKATAGFWRITPKGRAFLAGELMVHSWVLELRATVVATSEDKIDVHKANERRFNFDEEVRGLNCEMFTAL